MSRPSPSLVLRARPVWRGALAFLALASVGGVVADPSALGSTALAVGLAVWVWMQRIEVRGNRVTSHLKLHKGAVDLSDLQRIRVRRDRTRGLYRVVVLEDSRSTLSFMVIGWTGWRELARLVLDHALGRDEDGRERWRVETDGEIDWLLDAVGT